MTKEVKMKCLVQIGLTTAGMIFLFLIGEVMYWMTVEARHNHTTQKALFWIEVSFIYVIGVAFAICTIAFIIMVWTQIEWTK